MTTTGTIVQKDNGRWYVATHHRDTSGKRRQRWHGGFATKREAQARLAEVVSRIQTGRYAHPQRLTVSEYLRERWLPAIRSSVRESTFDSYQRLLDSHVIPAIGQNRLQQVAPDHLQTLYSTLLDQGGRHNEGLSAKTIRNIHAALRKALSDAVSWGLLASNPASRVRPPAVHRPELQVWTARQVGVFLDAVSGDSQEAAWRLAVSTGMRRGELLGLRWSDIDFNRKSLTVRQTLISVAYELRFSKPKTARGRRTIPLDGSTTQALQEHRRSQAEIRLASSDTWEDNDLVFRNGDGTPVHPDLFRQRFERLAELAGLPKIRFHDLRHTFATLAFQAGIQPRVVSDLLGHATVAFTLDTYGHLLPGATQEAVNRVTRMFEAR